MLSGLVGWIKRIIASSVFLYVLLTAILFFLLIHNLNTEPNGLSPAEQASKATSQSISKIINNPINAPHNLLAFGLRQAHLSWKVALRLSSAFFALIFIFSFYSVVRAWFGKTVGLLGTLFFAVTPLLLILGRQGSPEVMYVSVAAIMSAYLWSARSEKKDLSVSVLLIASALSLYTPGLIWWLLAGAIISRRKLAHIFSETSPAVITAMVLLGLLIIVPLGLAIAKDWTIVKPLALVPTHYDPIIRILKNTAWMILAIFVKTPYHSTFIIGRLPVLNIVQTALLALGTYALWRAAKKKLVIIAAAIIFAVVAAGINNRISMLALALPAVVVLVCAGLRYLYIEWRSVFPHNPLARSLAYTLMSALVLVQLLFGIRYAVFAWPNTIDTKNTYVLK